MARREPWLVERARAMRRDPTLGETILWYELRHRHFGARFRRQEVIGNIIADFACRSRRVIVEVDGESHDDPETDARRDAFLRQRGWTVLRFPGHELIDHREDVLRMIWDAVNGPYEPPPACGESAPGGGEGGPQARE